MGNISKLTPILYEKSETNFNHNGLGKLTKLLVNEIDEVLNGELEAFFEYPANGHLADEIDNEMFIKAKPNKKDEPHVFKIYDYELDTFTQTYLIYARSKNIEDLRNNVILNANVKDLAPTQAWNLAKNNALDPVVTTFYSDITTTSSVHWERRSLLSTIAGQEGSMIQYWGGEIKHDINRISLLRRRGQDNVTTVRHGKNLDGLKATYSTKGLVTAIVPYYVKSDDKSIYGNVVKSQYINNYPSTYYDIIEYNDEALGLTQEDEPEGGWEDSTIRTELNRVAKRYFDENVGKDLPSINMEISLEDISQTKEYENFKDFEQIEIGDTITVYSKKFGLNINAKVRRVVYNGLTDKNELVEVGTARRSLYDDVRDEFKKVEIELKEGIDHAMASADGKNTIYHGTADPNEVGLVGKNNDTYFRANGQFKEIWSYLDGQWHLEVGDLTGEQIKADIAEQQQAIEEAKQTADEAVEQIDTAVVNAGFTSLDETISSVQSISNQAQINSGTAINNALEAMQQASQAVDNTGSLNVRVDEVEGTLSVKADKQMVDDLTGVVDSQALDIQANAQGLALKANQSTVDTLAGTVSSLGTNFDIVAGQVNSRVWNTDIDAKIDYIETEWTQTFDAFSQTVAGIDGRVTQQKQTIDAISSTVSGHGGRISTVEQTASGLQSTVAGKASQTQVTQLANGLSSVVRNNDNLVSNPYFHGGDTTGWTVDFVSNADKDNPTREYYMNSDRRDIYNEVEFAVEGGETLHLSVNAWRAWVSSSTEFGIGLRFFDERMNHITWVIGATKHSFESETIKGQLLVPSGARFAHVWIYQNAFSGFTDWFFTDVRVSRTPSYSEFNSQITQLANNINLRVTKGELLSQINIEAGRTLIQSDRLLLNATNTVITGTAWMDGAVIANASIDGAKIADATIGSAKISALDVSKLSGNTSNFVSSNWNAVNSNLSVDGSKLRYNHVNGDYTELTAYGLMRYDSGVKRKYHHRYKVIPHATGWGNVVEWVRLGPEFNKYDAHEINVSVALSDTVVPSDATSDWYVHRFVFTQADRESMGKINGEWHFPIRGYTTFGIRTSGATYRRSAAGVIIVTV